MQVPPRSTAARVVPFPVLHAAAGVHEVRSGEGHAGPDRPDRAPGNLGWTTTTTTAELAEPQLQSPRLLGVLLVVGTAAALWHAAATHEPSVSVASHAGAIVSTLLPAGTAVLVAGLGFRAAVRGRGALSGLLAVVLGGHRGDPSVLGGPTPAGAARGRPDRVAQLTSAASGRTLDGPQNSMLARSRSLSKSTSTAEKAEMSSGRKRRPSTAIAVSMPRSK